MTADEAKQALKEGNRVRSLRMDDRDSLFMYGGLIIDAIFEFYKDDEWEIVE